MVVCLPGPPRELIPMFRDSCPPAILQAESQGVIRSRVLRLCGMGESVLVKEIADLLADQTNPTLGAAGFRGGGPAQDYRAGRNRSPKRKRLIAELEAKLRAQIRPDDLWGG